MYSIKKIIKSMFNNLKINISQEIYDIYDSEITSESIILHKMLLNFIVQVYGLYNLFFIVISLFLYKKINLDLYMGIVEIIIASFCIYFFNHWNTVYRKYLNFFIIISVFQFITVAYIQYSYSENILGFLPVVFSIIISSITIIKYNKLYNNMLLVILVLDIFITKLIYDESLMILTRLAVENIFIYYCAIFINVYFTKMKINEIINKEQLVLQRDTDGLTGLMNRKTYK